MGANGLGIYAPCTALPATRQETLMQHSPYRALGQAKQDRQLADRQAWMLRCYILASPLVHVLSASTTNHSSAPWGLRLWGLSKLVRRP